LEADALTGTDRYAVLRRGVGPNLGGVNQAIVVPVDSEIPGRITDDHIGMVPDKVINLAGALIVCQPRSSDAPSVRMDASTIIVIRRLEEIVQVGRDTAKPTE